MADEDLKYLVIGFLVLKFQSDIGSLFGNLFAKSAAEKVVENTERYVETGGRSGGNIIINEPSIMETVRLATREAYTKGFEAGRPIGAVEEATRRAEGLKGPYPLFVGGYSPLYQQPTELQTSFGITKRFIV